ncbi:hypothetical protein [Nocardia sp.]|uniref:hypothetical protein n=1 Tax=Nocardia sp. TaxID=1821 RepID=UPI002602C541|nr:hypothetical protein [Nocardia sp.]
MMTKGAWISTAVCAVLLSAGCGGSTSDTKATSADPAPSTTRDQLVLSGAEFPADTKPLDLPPDKLRTSVSDLGDAMAKSTVTPADCKQPQVDLAALSNDLISNSSLAAATTEDMTVYVEFVANKVADTRTMAAANEKCAALTSASTVNGQHIDTVVKMEHLPTPDTLSGIDTLAYRATSTSTISDTTPRTRTSYQGWATLRGMTVGVRAAALSGTPDQATFEKLFTDAVEKVRTAK